MINDHLDSKRGNPLNQHYGLLFLISSRGSFTFTDRTVHTIAL